MKSHLLPAAAALSLIGPSCGPMDSAPQTRVITVSPYSNLSDRDLNSHYALVLDELQALKDEMEESIEEGDKEAAHAKANSILQKAREVRTIASNFDDPVVRSKRIAAADELIPDLENLVEITR